VVTPVNELPEDVEVIAVTPGSPPVVSLRAAPLSTVLAGRYGMFQDRGRTHVRLGEVIESDLRTGIVTRPVEKVDSGRLHTGKGRWNYRYFAGNPSNALGLDYTDVEIPGERGPLRCWLVPGAALEGGSSPGGTWAILIHGRGATREECLRALPVLHRLGVTALVAGYRSTAGLPDVPAGRYHLGDREWQDVESAVIYAAGQGADEIVLFGWSMGGAMALQTVSRSWIADRIKGIVLDAPVLDWRSVLEHQAKLNRVPRLVGRMGQSVLSHRSTWWLAGTDAPVDLDRLDWVTRADELAHAVLLIHSADDEMVPSQSSRQLAAARPDLVTYVGIDGALHTLEWNVDPVTWETAIATFMLRL
jgi:uncharacterized protein